MDMKWLAFVFVFGLVFAETIVDTELGYVDVSGVVTQGDHFTLNGSILEITAASTKDFIVQSYAVSVTPRNLERIAKDLGVPLNGELNVSISAGQVHAQTIVLPEIVCGTYTVRGELGYIADGEVETYEDSIKLSIPCKDFKGKLIAGLVARVPYPILKFFAGMFGVKFG